MMNIGGSSLAAARRLALLFVAVVPLVEGCCGAQRLADQCAGLFRCEQNCDSCRPKLFPPKSPRDEYEDCTSCGGRFPSLLNRMGLFCHDPRVLPGHHGRRYQHESYDPSLDWSPWSTEGPGSFHPVPTRPVYGPRPTLAPPLPNDEEGPSDRGLESIPLKDLPRNLDTPSDPRNLIPADPNEEFDPVDIPGGGETSSVLKKKYPVQQTGWRPRTK